MTSRPAKFAAAVAAASALAGASYALGSQSDGQAVASKPNAALRGAPAGAVLRHARRDAGLDRLAGKLGVSTDALRTALTDLRPAQPREDLSAGVAKALGLDEAKVRAALRKFHARLRPGMGRQRSDRRVARRPGAALARELGVSPVQLRKAFAQAFKAQRAAHLEREAGALATALGVDAATVTTALEKLGLQRRGRGARVDVAAALAKQLGLETAQITAAFEKLREQRRTAFATALAGKLGIPVEKVEAALADAGQRLGRLGRGRHGPGRPGFGHP
jgi:hypothetical protein